jgi:hypothetical protein
VTKTLRWVKCPSEARQATNVRDYEKIRDLSHRTHSVNWLNGRRAPSAVRVRSVRLVGMPPRGVPGPAEFAVPGPRASAVSDLAASAAFSPAASAFAGPAVFAVLDLAASAIPGSVASAVPGPVASAVPGPAASAVPGPVASAVPGPVASAVPNLWASAVLVLSADGIRDLSAEGFRGARRPFPRSGVVGAPPGTVRGTLRLCGPYTGHLAHLRQGRRQGLCSGRCYGQRWCPVGERIFDLRRQAYFVACMVEDASRSGDASARHAWSQPVGRHAGPVAMLPGSPLTPSAARKLWPEDDKGPVVRQDGECEAGARGCAGEMRLSLCESLSSLSDLRTTALSNYTST